MLRFLFVGSLICLMLFAIAGCGKNEADGPAGGAPTPAVNRSNSGGSTDQEMAPPPTATPAATPSAAPAAAPSSTPANGSVQRQNVDPKDFEASPSNPTPLKGKGLNLDVPE